MKGLIHIYTGDGKGKTTAAMGLAVRALGAGLKVLVTQLFKSETSEKLMMEKLGIKYLQYSSKHPMFKKYSKEEMAFEQKKCEDFVSHAFELAKKEGYDLLVIDELGPALSCGMLAKEFVKKLISSKPEKLELVLTGRGFPYDVLALADYANDIKSIAHPFNKGVNARKGIEY